MKVSATRVAGRRIRIEARDLSCVVDDLVTDGGPGDGFRPSELLLGALGACTIGTLITFAANNGIDLGAMSVDVEAAKVAHPSRLGTITVRLAVEGNVSDRDLERLGRVASRCTIHSTLTRSPEISLDVVRA